MSSLPRFLVQTVKAHPRLLAALALACVVGMLIPPDRVPQAATRLLIAWNVGTCAYLILTAHMCFKSSPEDIQKRARVQAETRVMTILLAILAAAAGVGAIFAELSAVKSLQGAAVASHFALAILTIVSSWAFTHTMFALLYAHDYYEAASRELPTGLAFPDTPNPEYGDFLYFAFIIGTSAQTADVSFTSKPMRRTGLIHSVLSFLFNTTLLALTVNISASFF